MALSEEQQVAGVPDKGLVLEPEALASPPLVIRGKDLILGSHRAASKAASIMQVRAISPPQWLDTISKAQQAVVPHLIPLHYKERPIIPQIDKMLIQSAS